MNLGLQGMFKRRNNQSNPDVSNGVSIDKLKETYQVVEEYPIQDPFSRVHIVKAPELGEGHHYFVDEAPLSGEEFNTYEKIIRILSKELQPPEDDEMTPDEYVYKETLRVTKKYRRSIGKFAKGGREKILYYVTRHLAGYGPLQVLIKDPQIEDISHNGLNCPIFVWHRKFESIPTNITFTDDQVMNDFIVKLAHRSAKHISSARPILDAMLPEKHRLAATFMKEISQKGSTFCIRKFKADPFSIVDLIRIGTLDERIAAYFWLILEHKLSFMILGGTGSGKTSALNALLSLMSQNDKIVTVEEVLELTPPLANWTQLNSREGFQFGRGAAASITLFDLVKVSLRFRPDYIIVGEVRGEEAHSLFQALATGHGGLCTMHANSLDNVFKRLISPPMNVSKEHISLMNIAFHIQRVKLPATREGISFGRRVRTIWEIEDIDRYREVSIWNPQNDTFTTWFEDSHHLERIAPRIGLTKQEILSELDAREKYLGGLLAEGIRNQKDVAQKILYYYSQKTELEEALGTQISGNDVGGGHS